MDEDYPSRIPLPPCTLPTPNIRSVQENEVLHRIHDRTLEGNAFNPCKGGPTRFAPIFDATGVCVPSLYAASSVEAAVYETVFHDVPRRANRKSVPHEAVHLRDHSTLLLQRQLRLVMLHAPDLMKWGVTREQLVGSLPTQYERTMQWALAIHSQFTDVDGLVWTSNQCDLATAYLLFGDRVSEVDIKVVAVRQGSDASFLRDVREAGTRGGIVISDR